MDDERIHIWNLLHDGEITVVSPQPGESVTIFVSVPYLRRRFSPLGDSFVLSLSGVTLLEFHHFDGEVASLVQALETGAPEILSTASESMPVTIETTLGQLKIDCQSIGFALDTGQPVDYEAIEQVCEEYWAEWKARSSGGSVSTRPKPKA